MNSQISSTTEDLILVISLKFSFNLDLSLSYNTTIELKVLHRCRSRSNLTTSYSLKSTVRSSDSKSFSGSRRLLEDFFKTFIEEVTI